MSFTVVNDNWCWQYKLINNFIQINKLIQTITAHVKSI